MSQKKQQKKIREELNKLFQELNDLWKQEEQKKREIEIMTNLLTKE